jgi:hypothetical protein
MDIETVTDIKAMTLRDYFAGQALPAIFQAFEGGCNQAGVHQMLERTGCDNVAELIVRTAYVYADTMLAERSQP